jgi:hypothetical protein
VVQVDIGVIGVRVTVGEYANYLFFTVCDERRALLCHESRSLAVVHSYVCTAFVYLQVHGKFLT